MDFDKNNYSTHKSPLPLRITTSSLFGSALSPKRCSGSRARPLPEPQMTPPVKTILQKQQPPSTSSPPRRKKESTRILSCLLLSNQKSFDLKIGAAKKVVDVLKGGPGENVADSEANSLGIQLNTLRTEVNQSTASSRLKSKEKASTNNQKRTNKKD